MQNSFATYSIKQINLFYNKLNKNKLQDFFIALQNNVFYNKLCFIFNILYKMQNQTNHINTSNISQLKFDAQNLIPTIVQNEIDLEVVMFAWMSQESLKQTLNTGLATYFSRSRQNLWVKGETSGCYQKVVSITTDCDFDCLLLIVQQQGPACHTGKNSCFFNKLL